ncbi:MAG: FAD-dependent oxidoreductase, partial [Halobacteria archaeon]|nr:FAD-dependent oxidoreductase [Halobacteria archaeon]
MKEYASGNQIPVEECGVAVVAQDDDEVERLDELKEQADENGVEAETVDEDGLKEREPNADGVAALWCPEAASVDSQKYVYSLAKDAENSGVEFYMGHEVRD